MHPFEGVVEIGKKKWDTVLVNQYLAELREAKIWDGNREGTRNPRLH